MILTGDGFWKGEQIGNSSPTRILNSDNSDKGSRFGVSNRLLLAVVFSTMLAIIGRVNIRWGRAVVVDIYGQNVLALFALEVSFKAFGHIPTSTTIIINTEGRPFDTQYPMDGEVTRDWGVCSSKPDMGMRVNHHLSSAVKFIVRGD